MATEVVIGRKIQEGAFGHIWSVHVGAMERARKYFKITHQYDNEVKWNESIAEKEHSDIRTKFTIKMYNHDYDAVRKEPYFDMELAKMALFEVAVDKLGHLSGCPELSTTAKVEQFLSNLFNGLEFLHSSVGMLHNDIKPENILMKMDGTYAFCDFGFATTIKDAKKTFGMMSFAAPEHFDDSKTTVDETADVFALGISLLAVFDGYNGVPLPMDSNARDVVQDPIRRQRHFNFFKNEFRTPTATGRNLKSVQFKWQYATIIAAMVCPFSRPGCTELLQLLREVVQHGNSTLSFYDIFLLGYRARKSILRSDDGGNVKMRKLDEQHIKC